jgi:hypothetical protein
VSKSIPIVFEFGSDAAGFFPPESMPVTVHPVGNP